ncbi:MAG: YdcH family protein [Rhodobacteraceae bacterium]|nr:YdcH family protein [Paracoccaceae bacterium]
MSNTPHELSADFPDQIDQIHALKESDAHFARLVDEYHEVNGAVHRAETNIEPTDDLHLGELRKSRMHLKDEIARILAEATAKA